MSGSPQASTTPSKSQEDASQTGDVQISAIIKSLESLGKMYSTVGIAGFLCVVGAACILFTMFVAFQTQPGDEGSTPLNVDRGEELLFVISGFLFMILGTAVFVFRWVMKFRIEQLRLHAELARLSAIGKTSSEILEALTKAIVTSTKQGGTPFDEIG